MLVPMFFLIPCKHSFSLDINLCLGAKIFLIAWVKVHWLTEG